MTMTLELTNKAKARTFEQESVLSFKDFIFKNPWNRCYLYAASTLIIVQFFVFKLLYPYAGFIANDSYDYLKAALWNLDISVYPIGYSKFLRVFSAFSTSDIAVVGFQYFLIQSTGLLFLFTLFYFFKPGRVVSLFLLAFLLLNPLSLYVSNYVSSDALFLALSLLWITQLFWIIYKPTRIQIITHALILLAVFTVRYNALYYPFIGAIAFILSNQRIWIKIAGIVFSFIVIGSFIYDTSNKYKKLTGTYQFSPFSGWQVANNALYMYRNIYTNNEGHVPAKFKQLDRDVRKYFDTIRYSKYPSAEAQLAGFPRPNSFYQWASTSPLMIYMSNHFKNDTTASKFVKWSSMGPLYSQYGYYLIKKHPIAFVKYYLWPNLLYFYTPDVEFLGQYNMGKDTVQNIAQLWFKYKSNKVDCFFKDLNVNVLNFYPSLTGIINATFIISVIGFGIIWRFKQTWPITGMILLVVSLWFANLGFSVFASPPRLRFQIFPIILSFSFSLLLIELMYKKGND
jgi:hypothetical protein